MRKSRKILYAAVATAAAAGIAVPAAATAASASVVHPAVTMAHHRYVPPREVRAGVEITSSGYERYAQIFAVQQRGWKGYVDYTNFNVAETGSGVWAPAGLAETLTFTGSGGPWLYSLNSGVTLVAKSPTTVQFTGSGTYPGGLVWAIKGTVYRDHGQAKVEFTITYSAPAADTPYKVFAHGTIASDGSASGTGEQTYNGSPVLPLGWSLPAGSFQQVDHFRAPVTSESIQVKGQDATVSFVIPSPAVSAGVPITWQLHNGGRPAKDSFQETDSAPVNVTFPETVEAGHIQILP